MPLKLIDTHIHIWNRRQSPYNWLNQADALLQNDYAIEALTPLAQEAGVTDGVLVQADNTTADTEWMLQVAKATPWIKGVVGWLPLMDTAATEKMLSVTYSNQTYFKGVRHLIHDEADVQWLLQDSVIESLRILAAHHIPYDVVGVLPQHIETVIAVAARVPELRMVFDHMNQPPIAAKEWFGRWGVLMREAAALPQLHVKISGLGTTAGHINWQAEEIAPYVSFILDCFGEDRCFMGGDWPVSLLAGSYVSTWQKFKQALQLVADTAAREKIAYTNALRFYNL